MKAIKSIIAVLLLLTIVPSVVSAIPTYNSADAGRAFTAHVGSEFYIKYSLHHGAGYWVSSHSPGIQFLKVVEYKSEPGNYYAKYRVTNYGNQWVRLRNLNYGSNSVITSRTYIFQVI